MPSPVRRSAVVPFCSEFRRCRDWPSGLSVSFYIINVTLLVSHFQRESRSMQSRGNVGRGKEKREEREMEEERERRARYRQLGQNPKGFRSGILN